jgi:hypothetical protein
MHDHGTPERGDLLIQSAVLDHVLCVHPTLLSAEEIEREIDPGEPTRRAMRDLISAGLIRREGETVLPTLAALHLRRLGS